MTEVELVQDHGFYSAGARRQYDDVSAARLIEAGVAREVTPGEESVDEAKPSPRATRVKAADIVTVVETEK